MDVACRAFYRPGSEFQPLLDAWISEMPRSYAARLARGVFYTSVGFDRRGTCTADRTSCVKFDAMRENHAKALIDLEAAYAMNPRLVHALIYKMDIAMAAGDRRINKEMHDKALELNPLSLTVRFWRVTALLPRWGGSIGEMQAEIDAARPYYRKNPALRALEGRIAFERGDDAYYDARDMATAAARYAEALSFGSHPFYHAMRADALVRLGETSSAVPDIEAALAAAPNDPRAKFLRGYMFYKANITPLALADLNAALEGNPRNDEAIHYRGLVYAQTGNVKAAIADLERAIVLNPGNAEYLDHLKAVKDFAARTR
jgi:Tfp pilus assembly protein PilF